MPIDLTGKPIAIAGASSGIGAATALACARAGMPVAVGARRVDKLRELVGRIEAAGGRAVAVELDVVKPEACEAFLAEAERSFGPAYAVFANAGYGTECAIADMPDADVREMFEVNFFGTLNVVRPAVRRMLARPVAKDRGHVLICSSCVSRMALPYYGVYSATKAAQHHIGLAMGLELEPQGIHVSTVHPIGTRTEFFDVVKDRCGSPKLVAHTPDSLLQSPGFVADRIVACLRRPRPEVWTGAKGAFVRVGMSLCAMVPGLGNRTMRRMVREREQSSKSAEQQSSK